VLRKAVNVRELIHQAGGGKNPASNDGVTAGDFDAEAIGISTAHTAHATGEDLAAVAADLFTTSGGQLRWGEPFTSEITVHMCGGAVARMARVDDDHRPALTPELKRGGKPGG